jgi:hypothetical protein
VIGLGIFVVGLLVMAWWRMRDRTYWHEKPSVAPEV